MKLKVGIIFSLIMFAYFLCYCLAFAPNVLPSFESISTEDTEEEVSEVITKSKLAEMNRFSGLDVIDTTNAVLGKSLKILIIGNSIAAHRPALEIGWDRHCGMAATSMQNDYAHLLFKQIEETVPDRKVEMRIAKLVEFERQFSYFDYSLLGCLWYYQADIIIFQLGENVGFNEVNTKQVFRDSYIDLINSFKKINNPKIICTTSFFPSEEKNEIMQSVARKTKSYLVDLSHLALINPENCAKDEINYAGDKTIWKNEFIGIHPGDVGMRNIAKELFVPIYEFLLSDTDLQYLGDN